VQQIEDNKIIIDQHLNQDKKSNIFSFHKISALHASIFLYCVVIIITAVVSVMTGISYKVFEASVKDNYKKKTELLQKVKVSKEELERSVKDISHYNTIYIEKKMQQSVVNNINKDDILDAIKTYLSSSKLIIETEVQIEPMNFQNKFATLSNIIVRFSEYNHNIQLSGYKITISGKSDMESMVFNIIDDIKKAYKGDFILVHSINIQPIKEKELSLFNAHYYGYIKEKNDFNKRITFEIVLEWSYLTKQNNAYNNINPNKIDTNINKEILNKNNNISNDK
jgi:hypothetical protein